MPDIKTKETIKDIKVLDKSANLAARMREAYIRTKDIAPKERSEQTDPVNDAEKGAENITYESGHIVFGAAQMAHRKQAAKRREQKQQEVQRYERQEPYHAYAQEESIYTQTTPAPSPGAQAMPVSDDIQPTQDESRNTPKVVQHTVKQGNRAVKSGSESQSTRMIIKTTEAAARTEAVPRSAQQTQAAVKAAKTAKATEQQARSTAKATEKGLKKAEEASSAAVKAIMEAGKKLVNALMAGGSVSLIVIVVTCLVGLIAGSCFGIFFASEVSDGMTLQDAIQELNSEYEAEIVAHKARDYEHLHMTGTRAQWRDILSVYAVMITTREEGAQEAVTMNDEKLDLLREIFWDMNDISSYTEIETETVITEEEDEEGNMIEAETIIEHIHLYIHTGSRTANEMSLEYRFNRKQQAALEELLAEMDTLEFLFGAADITDPEALELWNNLPSGLSDERRQVVYYALTLVGKVNYFWGGKSLVLGWDSRWGSSMMVTAAGSPTTGTYRPYGMDCSGYVDWVFYNVSGGSYVIGRGGGCISQHNNCYAISWSEAEPGDLVFYPGDSHIGIVGGWDEYGNIQIIHCASGSLNGVVITGKSGFASIARPYYYQQK